MLLSIGMLVVMAAIFWLIILRPAKARQRAQQELANSLAPGQQVMTTAGVFGTVTSVENEVVNLEIADGVVIRILSAAIAKVNDKDTTEVESDPLDEVNTSSTDRPLQKAPDAAVAKGEGVDNTN